MRLQKLNSDCTGYTRRHAWDVGSPTTEGAPVIYFQCKPIKPLVFILSLLGPIVEHMLLRDRDHLILCLDYTNT